MARRTIRSRTAIERVLMLVLGPLAIALGANAFTMFMAETPSGQAAPRLAHSFWWALGGSTALAILFGFVAYGESAEPVLLRWTRWRRRSRLRKPTVLVLNGKIEDNDAQCVEAAFADRTPEEWANALRDANPKWTVNLGSVRMFREQRPDILLNPFGETYPEEALNHQTTFAAVQDFVAEGGIYVNVAGYPFFYKQDPRVGLKSEAGRWDKLPNGDAKLVPLFDSVFATRPLTTPAAQCGTEQDDVERRSFGEIAGAGGSHTVWCWRCYPPGSLQMIPLLRVVGAGGVAIGAVRWEEGSFLLCGFEVRRASTEFQKVLAAVQGWAKHEARTK